jgi:hypothetical protein
MLEKLADRDFDRPIKTGSLFILISLNLCNEQKDLPRVVEDSGRVTMHNYDQRLAAVTAKTARLIIRLIELNQLRERVWKAQLSTRRAWRIHRRRRVRI